MGVYIDMEMPDRCGHCRFATAFDCGVDGQFIKTHNARRKDCPLVPVLPHGRLIDADALSISTAVPLDGKPYQYVHIDNVKGAPTIIPADKSNMDKAVHIFEEDDEKDGMDSFIRILKD